MMDLHPLLRRTFDPEEVVAAKVGLLERWFRGETIDAVVVGVSGGVDSAVVLALLRRVKDLRVVALLLPIESRGATTQAEATERGRLVCRALDVDPRDIWIAPMTTALSACIESLEKASSLTSTPWSAGQCLSVMRTPALYGAAALLQAHGHRSIVAGTTNRDEGAYLGFFGKASDGMVDLQPIADLHKSEVRAVARHLEIPPAIVDATPRGDVHDGRTDEEMIGASYDAIESFLRAKELGRDPRRFIDHASATAIETQHLKNAHKYRVGSPAIHLDVLPRLLTRSQREERRPPKGVLPGEWEPPPLTLDPCESEVPAFEAIPVPPPGFAIVAHHVLTTRDCTALRVAMSAAGTEEPVDVTGYRRASQEIGSMRATAWAPTLAHALFERIHPVLPAIRFVGRDGFTDAFATDVRSGHRTWRLVGLSPVLRFMRYDPGGRHLCHYDAGFDYGDGRRTLLSVVFYLSDAHGSGATRFVRDGQEQKPVDERSFEDWNRDTRPEEVIARIEPRIGDALVFDHRICHDVERWEGPGERVIIRGDVVYEAILDGRGC